MKKKTNANNNVATNLIGEQEQLQNKLQVAPCTKKDNNSCRLTWDPKEQRLREDIKKEPLLLIRMEDISIS